MMLKDHVKSLRHIIMFMVAAVILKFTVGIALGYHYYFPPDFNSDFLHGRDAYFFDGYWLPFYAHLMSGPLTIVFGGLLLSHSLRLRFRTLHRMMGRVQVFLVLFILAPSGLWMAFYSVSGRVGVLSFAMLSLATGGCVIAGWMSVMRRRFQAHQRWMERCFVLLCSAVVLRVVAGAAVAIGVNASWFDPVASVVSWTVPLAVYELNRLAVIRALNRQTIRADDKSTQKHVIAESS